MISFVLVVLLIGAVSAADHQVFVSTDDIPRAPSDRRAAAGHQPHLQLWNRPGQYDGDHFEFDFPAKASGELAIALFGRSGAGKSRLIERILDADPGYIASARSTADGAGVTSQASIYSVLFPDLKLFVADTVGFGDLTEAGLVNVFQAALDISDALRQRNIPLKRLYFIIDISHRHEAALRQNLQFLAMALGPAAASQVRFVVNQCDKIKHMQPDDCDRINDCLDRVYRAVFDVPMPERRVLYVSAEFGMGQLCDDVVEALDQPVIELIWQPALSEAITTLKDVLNRSDPMEADLKAIIGAKQAELHAFLRDQANLKALIDAETISASHLAVKPSRLNSFWDRDAATNLFSKFDALDRDRNDTDQDQDQDRLRLFQFTVEAASQFFPNLGILLEEYLRSEDMAVSINERQTRPADMFQATVSAWRRFKRDYMCSIGISTTLLDLQKQSSDLAAKIAATVHELSNLKDISDLKTRYHQILALAK